MGMVLFGDQILLDRERKNLAILETVRKDGPVTKVDISRATNQNLVTVSNYIDNFLKKGLVLERGLDVSTGGRRPTLIELASRWGIAVGVGIGIRDIICVVTDLKAEVLCQLKTTDLPAEEEHLLGAVADLIERAITDFKIERDRIKGLGIGAPGIIDQRKRFAYKDFFKTRFGFNAFIDNEIILATFSEKWLALEPQLKNVLYMYSDRGCGIVLNGQIYRGTDHNAGRLDVLSRARDLICEGGEPCLFRTGEADLGIVSLARKAIQEGATSLIGERLRGKIEELTIEDVIEAAREGDKLGEKLITDAGVKLGIKIAYLVNLFAPQTVVIGGGLEKAGSLFLESVDKSIRDYAFEEVYSGVNVVPSRMGEQAVALGGAGIVIQDTFIGA